MLIDTHCHLDANEFAEDRDAVFGAARAAGVTAIIVPAVAVANFSSVRDCCQRYPGCLAGYGIHPLYVDRASESDLDTLRTWLREESRGKFPPVALGEIGLDFYAAGVDVARQEHFFAEQLRIARDFNLPVVMHVRRAVDAVLKHLRRIPVRGGIAHAFNGSRQQAEQFIELGFKLGFGGAMTYSGSTRIRELAATLPLEAIVLETDAPDISPVWLEGGRNSPVELARIAAVFAALRGESYEYVVQVTGQTAKTALIQGI